MKTFPCNRGKLLMIAIACSFAAGLTTTQAGAGAVVTDNARLVIHREADFGTVIFLNVFIDGVQVTMLGLNQGYEAVVRPGPHVLSISTTPCPYGKTRYTYRRVNMKGGQSYAFTAIWVDADIATLDSSNAANRSAWY